MLKRILAGLIAICALFLAACAGGSSSSADSESVTFTDALGRSVTVPKSPQRVAALIGSFADVWMLAGGEVCATADDAWDDFGLDLPADTVNLGATKNPNLELLFAADPDFVIASASTAKNVEWLDVLERAGITVAYFDVSNFADYLQMLNVCTDITGRKDLYEQNGICLRAQIDAMKSDFEATTGEDKTKVLFLRASAGYIRAKNSQGSILGEMLADLGCVNIADSDASLLENLSVESIIRQDPDCIFVVQVGDDAEAVKRNLEQMMRENPVWAELTAVKENRLYYMEKRLFNLKPNARWAEAYEKLINILQTAG